MSENWTILDMGSGEVWKGSVRVVNKSFKVAERADLSTTSRLWVWWLVKFRGYTVCQQTNEPKKGALGGVYETRRWFLKEPKTVIHLHDQDGD